MKFQLKISFLTKFSQKIVGKCPFLDKKKGFLSKTKTNKTKNGNEVAFGTIGNAATSEGMFLKSMK